MKSSCVIQVAVALMLVCPRALFAREDQRHPTSDTPSQAQAPETYVCPMHPEVRADQPGRCSKCQMLLEPIRKEARITVGAGAHTDHESKSGGMLTMVGDYHIELVEKDGVFQVYLYDAFTKPMTVAGLTNGTLTYQDPTKPQGTEPVTLPLVPNETNEFLMVTRPPGIEPEEVTVRLPYGDETFEMTFPRRGQCVPPTDPVYSIDCCCRPAASNVPSRGALTVVNAYVTI